MVELALTMKVKLTTNKHESEALNRLCDNYTSCCNEVSDWIGEPHPQPEENQRGCLSPATRQIRTVGPDDPIFDTAGHRVLQGNSLAHGTPERRKPQEEEDGILFHQTKVLVRRC